MGRTSGLTCEAPPRASRRAVRPDPLGREARPRAGVTDTRSERVTPQIGPKATIKRRAVRRVGSNGVAKHKQITWKCRYLEGLTSP